MTRWIPPLTALLLVLGLACAKKDEGPFTPDYSVLQVPGDYTLAEAAAVAEPGDRIILTGAGPFVGDVVLPPDVTLKRHTGSQVDLYEILGSLSVIASGEGTQIEGLKISNPEGSGLVLAGSRVEVSNCWFVDCSGAGVELAGNSPSEIHYCDMENCSPGILIRDVFSSGHYDKGTAPKITLNNFLDNTGSPAINLVFQNVAAGDTVKVGLNFWGAPPGQVLPDETIWDHKDDPAIKGLADTESPDFITAVEAHSRDWRD